MALNRVDYRWLIPGAVTLEVLAQTYGFYWQLPVLSSIVYLLAGMSVAVLPMLPRSIPPNRTGHPTLQWIIYGALALVLLYVLWRSSQLFAASPLDFRQADMLPVLKTMAQRLLSGEAIYAPIQEIWGGMQPIYLPAMWLPYLPALALDLDIRWLSVIAILGALTIIIFNGLRTNSTSTFWQLLGLLPVGLLIFYIFGLYSTLITLSEEPVVVFYYVLLAWAVYRKWPLATGLAMALCLLSRYSLAFWVPMYLVYLFLYRSRREAYRTAGAMAAALLILLTVGGAWSQLFFFLGLQDLYLAELLDDSKNWSFIAQIEKNPGLIKLLPYESIALWHRLLLIGSVLIPMLSFYLFKRFRPDINTRFFGLCSLKLSLVYFYNMLTIPYSYLFYPSTFLSLFILFAVFSEKISPKERNFLSR